ncbi:zinc-ribbon domain-containing protein [Micromonospora sp. D75]|nr:zinc-ribbon domain-containing protein [Micromonospora sp. D75]
MVAKPRETVASAHPELLPELLEVEGWTRALGDLPRGSNRKARWRCATCGLEWWQAAAVRVRAAAGCKTCRSRLRRKAETPEPGRSLAEVMPELAEEWLECLTYPTATPGTISAQSSAEVRWRCSACGHSWVAPISRRTGSGGGGCKPCASKRRSAANSRRVANRVRDACPEVVEFFLRWEDPAEQAPVAEVSVRSDKVAWWRCTCGNTWHTRVRLRVAGSVCPRCRAAKRRPSTTAPLRTTHPTVAAMFVGNLTNPHRTPDSMPKSATDRCRWRCSACKHEWEQTVLNVVGAGRPCPRCAKLMGGAPQPGRSLADLYPEIAAQFVANQRRPERGPALLRPNSVDRCLWRCDDCAHEWVSTVTNRTAGRGCPPCGRRRARELQRDPGEAAPFSRTHPEQTATFVASKCHPGRDPQSFTAGTSDICVWRCPECSRHFERSVATHATRLLCAACAYLARGVASRVAPEKKSLATLMPEVASSFVANISWPGHGPATLYPRAGALCSWRCRCGALFEAHVRDRAKSPDYGCGRCRRRGRSLLELELAHLLAAATGDEVEVDVRLDGGRRSAERLDLFLPSAEIYIDLDPAQWHSDKTAHARDLRKSEVMAKLGVRYVRVRQPGTPPVPGETVVAGTKDATEWYLVLAEWLRSQSMPCPPLSAGRIAACLAAAREEWKAFQNTPPGDSLAFLFPELAGELVENLTRPEMGAQWLVPGSADRCVWQCGTCRHVWRTRVVSRAQRKTGCPSCSRRERSYQARLSRPGLRVRDVAPELLSQAVRILDVDKARDIELLDLARGSSIRVLWRCPDCANEWVAPVVNRTSGRGCQPCGIRRRSAARRQPPPGGSLADLHPEVAGTFLENLDNPGRGPDRLRPGSHNRCRWHCPCCGSKEWETTVSARIKRQGCGGCRGLRVGRPSVIASKKGPQFDALLLF